MSGRSIIRYARLNNLYEDVNLAEIADDHRRKTGEDPVIAVDGERCVWYLYGNRDFYCGGQYKQFKQACSYFAQKFLSCGVQLVFFFHGLPSGEKTGKVMEVSKDSMGKIIQVMGKLQENYASAEVPRRLPEGLIPLARAMFRVEPSTEVRLCMGDCERETAQYAATTKNCLGIMSSNGNFLIYKDVPGLFTFGKPQQIDDEVRIPCFRSSDIASHLGLRQNELPALGTFLGNGTIISDDLRRVHGRLGSRYGRREHLASVVAEVAKSNTVDDMCRTAFGHRWREFVEIVKESIDRYEYKPPAFEKTPVESGHSETLQWLTVKHSYGKIPPVVLSIVKCRTIEIGTALEDLPHVDYDGQLTEEAFQMMRSRMYTVLLWETGEGPFYVEEQVTGRSEKYQTRVEVRKWLPPGIAHPGLLKLWTRDVERRWRLFSWIVGVPDPEMSAFRALRPRCLVVPATALYFLRHEARLVKRHEAEVLAEVAVSVDRLTTQQLARKYSLQLDPRAVFLGALFVRTALHVLDAAAVCGLSFPRKSDCQLDSYFDGKFFHELYLRAKAHPFTQVGARSPRDPSHLTPIHKFL